MNWSLRTIDLVTNLWPWPLVIVALSDNTWPQLIYHHQTFWVQSDLSVSWSIVPSRSVCSSQICVPTRTQPCCVNKLINSLTKLMSHLFPGHGAVPVILNIALHTRHAHKFLSLTIPLLYLTKFWYYWHLHGGSGPRPPPPWNPASGHVTKPDTVKRICSKLKYWMA